MSDISNKCSANKLKEMTIQDLNKMCSKEIRDMICCIDNERTDKLRSVIEIHNGFKAKAKKSMNFPFETDSHTIVKNRDYDLLQHDATRFRTELLQYTRLNRHLNATMKGQEEELLSLRKEVNDLRQARDEEHNILNDILGKKRKRNNK
jgi:hypothetical protein